MLSEFLILDCLRSLKRIEYFVDVLEFWMQFSNICFGHF